MQKWKMLSRYLGLSFVCLAEVILGQTPTVDLPEPDEEGWIKIFRGDNQSDFSIYTGNGSPAQEGNKGFGDPFYHQGGDTIRTDGNPFGQLIFKQNFSHYIMEAQLRWPGNVYNCGLMTKIQWNSNGQGGGLPQCIEVQGDPNQGMGQIWSLGPNGQKPWITFRGGLDPRGAKVDSTMPVMDFGNNGANCIVGYPGWQKPYPPAVNAHDWVTIRAEVRGRDTSRHYVNDELVMEYWNPRLAPSNDPNAVDRYLIEGMVSIQSEGGEVWYRNWRIKLLPEDPLYESLYNTTGCTDPNALNYNENATTSCADCCEYPCCNDNTFQEYEEGCTAERHDQTMCQTAGVYHLVRSSQFSMTSDYIYVTANQEHSIEVLNVNGQRVLVRSFSGPQSYDLKSLEPGIYFVKVRIAGKGFPEQKIYRF